MEKIKFQYTPNPDDYAKSMRSYSTNKQRGNAIANGLVAFVVLIMIGNLFLNYDSPITSYNLPLLIILIFVMFSSRLFAWMMKIRASKQLQLLQPITYEIDNQQIISNNQLSENKLDWSVFSRVIETKEHYLLIYTVNKNTFQFIPKRAFESQEQKKRFVELVEQKLGKIEDIQIGLRGWKLSLLTFGVFTVFSMGCILLAILLDS